MIRDTRILFLGCLICLAGVLFGADDSQISAIRAKASTSGYSPTSGDQSIINSYFLQSLDEMLSAESKLEAIDIRNEIIKHRGWKQGMDKYIDVYNTIAQKHIDAAVKEVSNWQDQKARLNKLRNLAVLTGQLESLKLMGIASGLMDNQDAVVRYWSVKAVANSSVASKLNSPSTGIDVTKDVLSLLEKRVASENTPEILDVIVRFGIQLKSPDATGLLIKICDKRIKEYENWTVRFEKMDEMLLQALAISVAKSSSAEKGNVTAKFAQLYSYVIQRYILGYDKLSSNSKSALINTIVEVEENSIKDLMGQKWGGLKKAIEGGKNKLSSLQNEHDVLLGADKAGQLAGVIKYEYDNTPKTSPKVLKSPK